TTVDDIVTGGDIPNNRADSFVTSLLEKELENYVTLHRPVETSPVEPMTTVDPSAQQFHPMTEQPKDNGATPRSVDWNNPRVAAILDAAAKCFARKGFSATTLAEIGKELGLRKSIVHYYFASKAALIHEVQSFTHHKYLEKVRDAIRASGDGSKQRMVSALGSLWEVLDSNKTATG